MADPPRDEDDIAPETVEIIDDEAGASVLWSPSVGSETIDLMGRLEDEGLSESERETVKREALRVLGRGHPPSEEEGHRTGLVVGRVQSGKTTSFTTVTALARDNGIRLVIIVAGTSNPLFNQSNERLRRFLGLDEGGAGKWVMIENPDEDDEGQVRRFLQTWENDNIPDQANKTILLTVLKHHGRIRNLNNLLERLNLSDVPVIVIDDEADHAGLNTAVRDDEMSTTYRRLLELRDHLPHHTYLQYTATPQAPLLINIIDMLSPDYSEVLTPGEDYVGNEDFFLNDEMDLIRTIPDDELPEDDDDGWAMDPPDTLLDALRVFILGVAVGLERNSQGGNRSMMIHPSRLTDTHWVYKDWVENAIDNWSRILQSSEEADKEDLIRSFERAYEDLSRGVDNLPSFDELVPEYLAWAVAETTITEVNAADGSTPDVDWNATYGHILVGGQAMDRGFTVKGLTVTYMPRGPGVGNIDTIQQRARFLGYKRPYLGFCRVYLEAEVGGAYEAYVRHENAMHRQLSDLSEAGVPLAEWKRAFILDNDLRATRRSVLDQRLIRGRGEGWFVPRAPHDAAEAIQRNQRVVDEFLDQLEFMEDKGHAERTEHQRHEVARRVPLQKVLEDLLVPYRVSSPRDSSRFTGRVLQVKEVLEENPDETCDIYYMSKGRRRERSVDSEGDRIPTIHQGASTETSEHERGEVYPGDSNIRADSRFTIQIHKLKVMEHGGGRSLHSRVPALTICTPEVHAEGWVTKPRESSR